MKMGRFLFMSVFIQIIFLSLCKSQDSTGLSPIITEGPEREVFFNNNTDVLLTCEAEGVPSPSYTWRKDGEILNCSNKYMCDDNKILVIYQANITDEGYYQCFATNSHGSAMSDIMRLRMYYLGEPNNTIIYPSYSINTHQRLACDPRIAVPSNYDRALSPEVTDPTFMYMWSNKTDYQSSVYFNLTTSSRLQIHIKTGDLWLSNGDVTGTRYYRCHNNVPTSQYTSITTLSGYHTVSTTGSAADFVPYPIAASKVPDVGLENQSVLFQCLFAGRPTPSLTSNSWSKVGGSLPAERVTFTQYFTRMRISNLQPSDAGVYRCEPEGYPGIGSTISLEVKAVPRFNSELDMPTSRNASNGENASFNCKPYAVPTASIKWYKNGEELNSSYLPLKFSLNEDHTQLTISNVCRDCGGGLSDLMTIQCNVSNAYGYTLAEGYLNIAAEFSSDKPTDPTVTATTPIPTPTPGTDTTSIHTHTPGTDTTPIPTPTPGTVICYNCEGTAASSCGINVDTAEVAPLFCLTGYCATVTYTSVGNNTISRVIRSCGKSDCTATSCSTYGAEMMCINICKQSFCNGDITIKFLI